MLSCYPSICFPCLRALVVAGVGFLQVQAAELDWGTVGYPAASRNTTFNNVDGTSVDITLDFPSTGTPIGSNAGSPNPNSNTDPPNGYQSNSPIVNTNNTTAPSLFLELDFRNQTTRDYITLDISFSEAVNQVSLTVFDIDFTGGDFQDLVIIRGITSGGTAVAPTTLTDDPFFNDTSVGFPGDFTDTIFSDSATDADLQGSTIVGLVRNDLVDRAFGTWDFGSQNLVGLQVVYTNSVAAPANPMGQAVSIGNISFTPVIPEAETYWAGGALLALIGLYEFRRRRRLA